ncbi:MAG: ATP-binding cassette domain-containing protein [Parvularculales bacterium]
MLHLEDVSVSDKSENIILEHVNLHIEPGGFYLLTGASGSGKTALFERLALVRPPSRGVFTFCGYNVSTLTSNQAQSLRRRIGIFFQKPRLMDYLTLYENIALPLEIAGEEQSRYHHNILELLSWFGLEGRENQCPTSLSPSEQRDLALARAVVTRPPLLVADDLLADSDKTATKRILSLLTTLNRYGMTIVMTLSGQTVPDVIAHKVAHRHYHLQSGVLAGVKEGHRGSP